MKSVLVVIVCLLAVAVIALFVMGIMSRTGGPPGQSHGVLLRCPPTPNCVCSELSDDSEHFIEPIVLTSTGLAVQQARLAGMLRAMGGQVGVVQDGYLSATFTSALFGFVDDLEIRIDAVAGLAQVRSASRVGRGDAGVNRRRVERLRMLYAHGQAE